MAMGRLVPSTPIAAHTFCTLLQVEGEVISCIEKGLLCLVGLATSDADSADAAEYMCVPHFKNLGYHNQSQRHEIRLTCRDCMQMPQDSEGTALAIGRWQPCMGPQRSGHWRRGSFGQPIHAVWQTEW